MTHEEEVLSWFKGNRDAAALYEALVEVAHTWDDLVDKDKPVSDEDINRAFMLALVTIPANPVYHALLPQLQPLLINAVAGYAVANKYEAAHDAHGIEIAHTLRYSISQAMVFLIVHFNGLTNALEILPRALKVMIPERFAEYEKEHSPCSTH